jgi:hypothetical protein
MLLESLSRKKVDSRLADSLQEASCAVPHTALLHVHNALHRAASHCLQFQNMLTAVPHPHAKTGHKDPRDPCNRTDKRNGGQYRRFERQVQLGIHWTCS